MATGAIVKGNLRTGAYETIVDSANGPAVGVAVDAMQRVWVAGGTSGGIQVHDGATGSVLGSFIASTTLW